jgi:hypothetical protein
MQREAHVREDALVSLAMLGRDDPEVDVWVRAHVSACHRCADRLGSITRLLSDVRATGAAAVDEVFDAPRLERQREQILRRLEHAGRPGRVIEFPHRYGRMAQRSRPVAVRWMAAAAAVGLFVGITAGRLADIRQHLASDSTQSEAVESQMARATPDPVAAPVLPTAPAAPAVRSADADDQILDEIEALLDTQSTPELQALDALTPRFREIGFRIR